ncbi:unnamed protein product, partial [Wuchereria bancrofti]
PDGATEDGPQGPPGDEGVRGPHGQRGLEGQPGLPGERGESGSCEHCPEPRFGPNYWTNFVSYTVTKMIQKLRESADDRTVLKLAMNTLLVCSPRNRSNNQSSFLNFNDRLPNVLIESYLITLNQSHPITLERNKNQAIMYTHNYPPTMDKQVALCKIFLRISLEWAKAFFSTGIYRPWHNVTLGLLIILTNKTEMKNEVRDAQNLHSISIKCFRQQYIIAWTAGSGQMTKFNS